VVAPVRIALVGAGFIADYHLGALAGVPEAEVVVVASRTAERARDVAQRFAVPEASDDVLTTVRRRDVDAVLVTTPDDTHESIAIAALDAGKAVLLQKPMASTAAACRRIIAAAARTGRDLQVSWMHRHFAEVVIAREMLSRGAIGRPETVRLRNATPGPDWGDWFFRKDAVSGGVVHQLGIHGIDLVGHVFGRIEAVSARTATLRPQRRLRDGRVVAVENPDTALAVYAVAGGPLVNHEMSMIEAAGTDRFRMEICGEAGALWLRTERGLLASALPGTPGWIVHGVPETPMGVRQHAAWIDGLLGRGSRETTALDGLQGMLVAEAIARSAARGGAEVAVEAM
jgi:predicted dehydrogenase